jgi:TonB family protein
MAELSSPAAVIEIGTAVPWVRKHSSAWVRGPLWDGFWMLSALWLAPIVLLLVHGYSDPESSPLDLLYFGLTALFWIGHRLSSTYLAYCTEAYRPLLREQPIRFIVLPLLVTAGCFALFLPADSELPWTREERLIGLAIIDYGCVTYHFAAQHFGALSLYRSRADRGSCIQTRRWDRFFALTAGGVIVFVADILAGAVAYQDQWVDRWFPAWIVSAENLIRGGATLALFAITAIILVAELRTPRWSLPRILYIVGLAVMVGLALRPRSLFLFLVIWTSQHWILATGLASQTPSAESAPTTGVVRRYLHRLNVRPWAVVLFLMLLSLVFLPIFEVEANRETGTYYGDRIFGSLAVQLRTSTWLPVLLALGFATGFIHYLLDRSVYRMSDPQVRAAASGLIGNVGRPSRRKTVSSFALFFFLAFVSVCSLHAQIGTPPAGQQPPKAIYTPKPVYRPEWAKQGLAGKGVVLVTIDQQTGRVSGVRMLQSTGNKQLDGAALEAYSQWRFQPGTGSQVKIPIEFASRPKPPAPPKRTAPQPAILYPLLILLGFGLAVIAMRARRRSAR